ncbi:MAG: hypothetical protein AAFQ94_00800 [Bacteroidota bacterium]
MDQKKLYTIGLKFQRHQLEFRHDEASGYVIMGKAQKVKRKLFIGISLIIIGLLVAIVISVLQLGFVGRILRYLFLIVVGYGAVESFKQFKLGRANRFRKLISENAIKIESKEGIKEYSKSDIQSFEYESQRTEEGTGLGTLFLITNSGDKVQLLKLADKKPEYLHDDFTYLKSFLDETILG